MCPAPYILAPDEGTVLCPSLLQGGVVMFNYDIHGH